MKKTILFSLLLAAASSVSAGEYEHQLSRRKYCEAIAGLAGLAYNSKQDGKPRSYVFDQVKDELAISGKQAEFLRYGINYAYDKADSSKDAFMKAWANCMDNTN